MEKVTDPCEVCNEPQAETLFSGTGFDGIHQNCPRCGEFKLSGTAFSLIRQATGKDKRAILSGWVRNQNRTGAVPIITSVNLEQVLNSPLPTVAERAMFLLLEAERGLTGLGDRFDIREPRFLAATYSQSYDDVNFLLQMLSDQGYAEATTLAGGCEILPGGYVYLDELRGNTSTSINGFVAMSFHEDLSEYYSNGFQVGIIGAGYEPIRMDRIEHINRIDDEIIRQINSSKFLVADFTEHKGGVYFEAGYAMGKNLPIFWTCRKTDMKELHFDIRQFNCIGWETAEELAERLAARIEAVLGRGPR